MLRNVKEKFYKYSENFVHTRGFSEIAGNGLALGAVADFGAQNCQYTTKVDAR